MTESKSVMKRKNVMAGRDMYDNGPSTIEKAREIVKEFRSVLEMYPNGTHFCVKEQMSGWALNGEKALVLLDAFQALDSAAEMHAEQAGEGCGDKNAAHEKEESVGDLKSEVVHGRKPTTKGTT